MNPFEPNSDDSADDVDAGVPEEREAQAADHIETPGPGEPAAPPGAGVAAPEAGGQNAQTGDDADEAAGLSPSVRRLVKQYDLDVARIRGTGPGGRIRTNDVIAVLGNRAAPPAEEAEMLRPATVGPADETPKTPAASRFIAPVTSVFECDMTAALTHRKQILSQKSEVLLTSYYVLTCFEALEAVPEVNGTANDVKLGVALSGADGHTVTPVLSGRPSLTDINEALRSFHQQLLAGQPLAGSRQTPSFFVYHHGLTGSLLATPTPMGEQHAASLGIGRIRRQVVVQNVSGQQGPRIAPFCYVSLTFDPEALDIHRANQFLTHFVRTLEQWPPL